MYSSHHEKEKEPEVIIGSPNIIPSEANNHEQAQTEVNAVEKKKENVCIKGKIATYLCSSATCKNSIAICDPRSSDCECSK